MIFQQKLRGVFHIIFCSKPLPLQVTVKSSIFTPYGCALDGVVEGGLNKKLYERHPLVFAEKSPFKIV